MRMADRGARDTNKPGAYAKWPIVSDSILLLRFFSEIRFQCFSEMTPVACTSCRSQRCNSVQLAVPGNRMTPPPVLHFTLANLQGSRTFKNCQQRNCHENHARPRKNPNYVSFVAQVASLRSTLGREHRRSFIPSMVKKRRARAQLVTTHVTARASSLTPHTHTDSSPGSTHALSRRGR